MRTLGRPRAQTLPLKVTAGRGSQLTQLVERAIRDRPRTTYTAREIADKFGVHPNSVRNILTRLRKQGHDIERAPLRSQPQLARRIYRLVREEGVVQISISELATTFSASESNVCHALAFLRSKGYISGEKGRGRRPSVLVINTSIRLC